MGVALLLLGFKGSVEYGSLSEERLGVESLRSNVVVIILLRLMTIETYRRQQRTLGLICVLMNFKFTRFIVRI